MKKIIRCLMMVIAVCMFAFSANSFSLVEASSLYTPTSYWNNDNNYPVAFSQNGVNRYVDLSSAKIVEQTETAEGNIKSAVFTYDVIMVNGDNITKFSYKTMIRFIGEEVYIASARANSDSWSQLSNRSFDQPQYNATLILAEHFNLVK